MTLLFSFHFHPKKLPQWPVLTENVRIEMSARQRSRFNKLSHPTWYVQSCHPSVISIGALNVKSPAKSEAWVLQKFEEIRKPLHIL